MSATSLENTVADSATKTARRPKSDLRKNLERLQPGQRIIVTYGADKLTPFSVAMAIKRKQLGKHFVFQARAVGRFEVWVGDRSERSKSSVEPSPSAAPAPAAPAELPAPVASQPVAVGAPAQEQVVELPQPAEEKSAA